jgi:hypothetical protein
MQGIGSLGDNWKRSKQNREILGDVYTDDLRKSMMTDDDLKFYNKYIRLGDMRSGQEAQYYYDEANKALQNAQITNRINYTLGQPKFGFETTAPAGVANIDYSTLADRMVHGTDDSVGLAGTAAGKAFLADAYKAQEDEPGDTMMSHAMKSFGSPRATFTTPAEIQGYSNAVSVEDIMPIEGVSNQPNIDDYNEMMTTPFNAASMYPNLSMAGIRNKHFPGMALEDITQEDIDNAIAMKNYGFMSSPQLNQLGYGG